MKFEINFNKENDDETLMLIGAKEESTNSTKYPPFERYVIDLNSFEELETLLAKVSKIKKDEYSAIINFDNPTIFLDSTL